MAFHHMSLYRGRFHFPGLETVIFGQAADEALAAETERLGAKRVFLLTTRSLVLAKDGFLQKIIEGLGPRLAGTFSAIRAHSPQEDVIGAAWAARRERADLLVAVGGGSVIDAAKAVQLCLWMDIRDEESLTAYRNDAPSEMRRLLEIPERPIRLLTVSTTLSASEFTSTAGITDSRTRTKHAYSHPLLAPRTVILDPAATLTTPEGLLFSTAVRSLDHAVESYCSPLATPATEAFSLQGLRLLTHALPRIKADPKDLRPRQEAQFGMWQAIMALASGAGAGASHGIGYALGARFGVPHGICSCVLLPAVLRWNNAVNRSRQRDLSEAMGRPEKPTANLLADLIASLDLPGSLRAVRIGREDFDEIAHLALSYPAVRQNPRPIRDEEDIKEILELAW
jgi:maleylacetate reductase